MGSLERLKNRAIAGAVGFLQRNQLDNGEFRIFASTDRSLATDPILDRSPSVTAFVLHALRFVDDPRAPEIRDRAIDFLVREMEAPGLWRYWTSETRRRIDYDLDDTSWVSYILKDHHPHIYFGSNIKVILANRDSRGLFYTFFRRRGESNDVDSVVNANVLLYLGERDETRGAVDYLNGVVSESREEGSYYYYLDHLSLYYAVSRAYQAGAPSLGRSGAAITRRVLARQRDDGSFGDDLATAYAVCTLLNYGYDDRAVLERAGRHLVGRQNGDGSWARIPVWAGPEPPAPHSVWWGSEEFTTAIAIEALGRSR